ncbi:hypothetical protein [Erythrobacter aureus]|uniref:Phosphoadenosine phosphosulfate reductase n=1 Tax=Erythrobacter aureus TaxID=2182384 RepID=A0A345YJH7_9SPHN|nr:hypothetical protein [Erythrobacter aureus]AXK44079.1 hypothetical protein DVR09_16635 [Erythrobacter aureus]
MKKSQLDIFQSSQDGRAAAAAKSGLLDAIKDKTLDRPVMVSLGMGVDSVAMTIALIQLGRVPDLIIFADTGSERPETYDYIETFNNWLRQYGIQVTIARYCPVKAPYDTLEQECLTNGILPGIALGRKSCSIKWKQDGIHQWLKGVPAKGKRPAQPGWQPAIDCWERGERVVKLIGFDAGAKDRRRGGIAQTPEYDTLFLLRELGMDRLDCARLIRSVGLPIPLKSACFFCSANKPEELKWLHHKHPNLFRRALVLETNAMPKLKKSDGLWRSTRKRDNRSGNWNQWALDEGLIVKDDNDPDGFTLVPQNDPPLHYPDDEIGHLLRKEALENAEGPKALAA